MSIDRDRLRSLLQRWDYQSSPAVVVAMGSAALELLLDSLDGKADLWSGKTENEGRDFDDARSAAVAAFAKDDLPRVLRSLKARGWSDTRVALCGIGRVPDARVVPYLLSLLANKEPLDRARAVSMLEIQPDERATVALTHALKDRSSTVREAAASALSKRGKKKRKAVRGS